MEHTADAILHHLKSLASPENVAGMARYGINPHNMLGVSIYTLRPIAKEIGSDHALALQLWDAGIHEARLLASYVDDPAQVTEEQMEAWGRDFDSWDVCDQVCGLFEETRFAWQKAIEWSSRPEEFVKRAAFALMAGFAVHDKQAGDERFEQFFPIIVREASDGRNFVKKAVNWALRNIGKRNRRLNDLAIETARQIQRIDSRVACWIAADALRELASDKIQARLS